MSPLSVVCWKWKPPQFYERAFNSEAVNTLYSMVKRHYSRSFHFYCFTDDPEGIIEDVTCVELRDDFAGLESPLGVHYPACYRRLHAFGRDFSDIVGPRYVSLDLDCVIVDSVDPLWDRKEDIVFWESHIPNQPYNGSMWLHTCGTRPQVLGKFDSQRSPKTAKAAGFVGSDQAWLSYILPNEAVWTKDDGVVNWQTHCRNRQWQYPEGSRIVFFPGMDSPWDERCKERAPWIREHYK